MINLYFFCTSCRSKEFRPCYGQLHEVRTMVPKGIPLLACTATATIHIRHQVTQTLQMENYAFVQASPDRPNIYYKVHRCTDISTDFNNLVKSLKQLSINAPRVIVYRRTLDMFAYLYSHFLYEPGRDSYYPKGAEELCCNRLFGMYHSCTPQHNKEVILGSLAKADGTTRVVFATVALRMHGCGP